MTKRIVFGAIMIVLITGLLFLDWRLERGFTPATAPALPPVGMTGLPLAVLFILLATVAFMEVQRFAAATDAHVLPFSGLLGSMAVATLPYWWQLRTGEDPSGSHVIMVIGMVIAAVFLEQMFRRRVEGALRDIAATMLAVGYLGVGSAMVLSIRMSFGVPVLVLFLAAVKCTDIGAYFTGSAIGRHKLIPWLSPGKSWEGLVGGLLFAAGVSVLATWAMQIPLSLPKAAAFGVIIGGVGQFADLCESLLKRSASLKDSGAVVPGFGGVMDIIDSPLLSAPVAWLILSRLMG